jgi:hypothetical protein
MKQRVIWINLLLLAVGVWCAWRLRANYLEARERERDYLSRRAKGLPVAPYQAAPAQAPAQPASFADIALRTLFAKDRNPNVIVEPPPPPAPPPPVPAFPKAYGVIDIGEGPLVFLGQGDGKQRLYKQGDVLGPWKIGKILADRVTFEWVDEKKTFEKTLDELRDRGASASSGGGGASDYKPAVSEGVVVQKVEVQKVEGPVNAPGIAAGQARLCNPGDTSPSGAVVDGYRKVLTRTPFGEVCRWEPVQ